MIKRAIVLVPSFSKREKAAARNQLVNALTHYGEGYKITMSDQPEDADVAQVKVVARTGSFEATLDIFEAFWGDLIPDWSNESPWQRFQRGWLLILYWMTGGLAKSLWHWRGPPKTLYALAAAGLALVFWYFIVISVLLKAIINDPDNLPAFLASLQPAGSTWVVDLATWLNAASIWPFVFFIVGILGKGFLEGLANLSAFIKSYLRDDPLGEDDTGIRAKSRKRLLDTLDAVTAADYDEIHVVAHSLGSAIAVDALAEIGDAGAKITLHTWGSMLSLIILQEPLIERELAKMYTDRCKIVTWVDVSFRTDYLSSPRPRVRQIKNGFLAEGVSDEVFPPTIRPRMPWRSLFSKYTTHAAYYRSDDAMLMLVRPATELPQRVSPPVAPAAQDGQVQDPS